jgi:hypothetical protein
LLFIQKSDGKNDPPARLGGSEFASCPDVRVGQVLTYTMKRIRQRSREEIWEVRIHLFDETLNTSGFGCPEIEVLARNREQAPKNVSELMTCH